MELQHLTWPEVEACLARTSGIILPIGSTEQHGPTGLIGTDAICADAIARRVGEATDSPVAPVIAVGMAQHHMGFAGTMTLQPATLIAVITDMVASLAHHGFRRFFFINGHGGNINTIRAAFSQIHAARLGVDGRRGDLRLGVTSWWESREVMGLARKRFGGSDGLHATASEISVTRFLFPDLIKTAPLDPPVAPTGPINDAVDYRRRFPDGRIGSNPALASPEAGRELVDAAVAALAQRYRGFLSDP